MFYLTGFKLYNYFKDFFASLRLRVKNPDDHSIAADNSSGGGAVSGSRITLKVRSSTARSVFQVLCRTYSAQPRSL
jgi:hypothetical protein